MEDWPCTRDDYELHHVIGRGATALVHAAICLPRNEKCAIKRIKMEKINVRLRAVIDEVKIMSSCNHENLATYHTSFVVKAELWVILRLLEGGSLHEVIQRKMLTSDCKRGVFDEKIIATVLKEILKGLEYFHSNGYIHRDLKSANVLIGGCGTVQISDFGLSIPIHNDRDLDPENKCHSLVGTPCWMAPEIIEQEGYDFKADIWAFGITAIEMVTGLPPYYKYSPMKVIMLTVRNDPPNLDTCADSKDQYKAYSKKFRKMIAECLQKDPSKRPTAGELLKHAFFKKALDPKNLSQNLLPSDLLEMGANGFSKSEISLSNRRHRSVPSEWEWSSEEEDSECDDESTYRFIWADSSDSIVELSNSSEGNKENNLAVIKPPRAKSAAITIPSLRNRPRQLHERRKLLIHCSDEDASDEGEDDVVFNECFIRQTKTLEYP